MLGPSEALNLFRICQEAIANALKHAECSELRITIAGSLSAYKIAVADNGKGFDQNAVNADLQNGLENMRFRAGEIGAELTIAGVASSGTEIRIQKNSTDAV